MVERRELAEIDVIRLTLAKSLLELLFTVHETYMPDGEFGRELDTMAVCMAVYVGHMEGRPFNALKLADFLQMPRTTVLRKLADLRRRGDIRHDRGVYLMTNKVLGNPDAARSAARMIETMRCACSELSKMDTKPIDSR